MPTFFVKLPCFGLFQAFERGGLFGEIHLENDLGSNQTEEPDEPRTVFRPGPPQREVEPRERFVVAHCLSPLQNPLPSYLVKMM